MYYSLVPEGQSTPNAPSSQSNPPDDGIRLDTITQSTEQKHHPITETIPYHDGGYGVDSWHGQHFAQDGQYYGQDHVAYEYDSTAEAMYNHNENAPSSKKNGHTGSATGRFSSMISTIWLWEILASTFSVLCMVAVLVVLLYEQDRPLSEWQRGLGVDISPTAVVSFLGTLAKSSALVASAEIISQLKWHHFSTPQHLSDLELFDSASRGPWGAFTLAVRKNRSALLAVCGSLIIVAALLVEPFIQLVFSFPERRTAVPDSGIPIASTQVYDPNALAPRQKVCYGPYSIPPVMQAAALAPIWSSPRNPNLDCPYESCKWPSIQTLGVCSECEDLPVERLESKCWLGEDHYNDRILCNYTLPTSPSTHVTFPNVTFAYTGRVTMMLSFQPLLLSKVGDEPNDPSDSTNSGSQGYRVAENETLVLTEYHSITFAENLPWDSYIERGSNGTGTEHLKTDPPVSRVTRCALSMCARTFTAPSYHNSTASPLTGPTDPLILQQLPPFSTGTTPQYLSLSLTNPNSSSSPQTTTTSNANNSTTTFRINICDFTDLAAYMSNLFTIAHYSGGQTGAMAVKHASPDKLDLLSAAPPVGAALHAAASSSSAKHLLPEIMRGIADNITDVIRTSANSTTTPGTGFRTVTYIEITWSWLILPVFVVLSTFILLIVVILRTRSSGVPVWKSSSLALLFHHLEGWDRAEVSGVSPQNVSSHGLVKDKARVGLAEDGAPLFVRQ